MKRNFLAALADAILPGDAGPGSSLPAASALGLASRIDQGRHIKALAQVASVAGGEDAFIAAAPAARTRVLLAAEREDFAAFRDLVAALLAHYYEHPAVMAALGWRAGPAQPLGHRVPEADAATLGLLDKVQARGAIWRPAD